MKTKQIIKRRYLLISIFFLVILSSLVGYSQNELKTPYPIIFVHGLVGNDGTWNDFVSPLLQIYGGTLDDMKILDFCLNNDGNKDSSILDQDISLLGWRNGDNLPSKYGIYAINFDTSQPTPYDHSSHILSNQAAIFKQGKALGVMIDLVLDHHKKYDKVILVGHSMGGLAIREYLQRTDSNGNHIWWQRPDDHHVAKALTIATPHGGSDGYFFTEVIAKLAQNVDRYSEAVRDLNRTSIFLKGGIESDISTIIPPLTIFSNSFYNRDVNCNGSDNSPFFNTNTDEISGLNELDIPVDLAYSCIIGIGDKMGANGYPTQIGDGVVAKNNANINNYFPKAKANVFVWQNPTGIPFLEVWHSHMQKKFEVVMEGLDEPNTRGLAYEINEVSTINGFITRQSSIDSWDLDYFKIRPSKNGTLTLSISSFYFPLIRVELLDDYDVLYSTANTSAVEYTIEADPSKTYFLKIIGESNSGGYETYKLPYTIQSSFIATAPAVLSVSPTSLQYNDVVIGSPKDKIITLDNKGTADILITSIAKTGSNMDQFSVSPMPPFAVTPTTNQNLTVAFNPTGVGVKVATIEITTNSSEIPIKKITLSGNGVANETKVLVTTPALSYLFDDTKVGISISKTITLKNTGSNNCTINNITLGGNYPADFAITSSLTFPFDIGTGAIKQFTIQFNPTSIGAKAAILVIDNNSDNTPIKNIELYGNGLYFPYSGNNNTLTAYEYWIDDQYNAKIYTAVNTSDSEVFLNAQFNTDQLNFGLHVLNIRYKDKKGKWSAITNEYFYKLPLTESVNRKIKAAEYWLDDSYASKVTTEISDGQLIVFQKSIDVNSINNGLHILNIRYVDDAGFWSSIMSQHFYKFKSTELGSKIVTYRYWLNNDFTKVVYVNVSEPNQFIFLNESIDLSSSVNGAYAINFQFKDNKDQWSSVLTHNFTLTTLSMMDNSFEKNILVYPNPTYGNVNIDLGSVYDNIEIRIFDLNGRIVKEVSEPNTNKFNIDLNMASGTYNMIISSEGKKASFRIIKN